MNDEDANDKALTAAMLERMTQSDNAIQFGLAMNQAFKDFAGYGDLPFTLLLGMPDGTLTRFTNLDPESSLSMVAETLRLAMVAETKTFISTATKQ